VLAKLSRLTAGWDIEMGAAAFGWVANEFLLPTKHSDVLARLHSHQAEEHRVVLLSGVFLPCLELIGAHLGVRDLIGTRLEIHEDKYTGSIIPPIITGKDKLPALRDFIATRGLDVDWQASFAYADSIYDRSILEAVGNPVAANPDSELLALARARDWEVLEGE
jgi:phosphoserine phosphatase